MPIDFHDQKNRYTYATRNADSAWIQAIRAIVEPEGKRVADIGCGGGIYSEAWHALGAAHVIGVDFSAEMVAASQERAAGQQNMRFVQGDASQTGLPGGSYDIVFQRALIHHLDSYDACFAEARRLLAPGGLLIIQDRTVEDVNVAASTEHLRGYFFDRFPKLRATEAARRPVPEKVYRSLKASGFQDASSTSLWETRKMYAGFEELARDLADRTGRSILHHLSDDELTALIDYIESQLPKQGPITEKDRWTIWTAQQPQGQAVSDQPSTI
jgi:ubiquinone/menaquinone biosynthesis C-methylase UbiE